MGNCTMEEALWSLLGIIVGFSLSELSVCIKSFRKEKLARKALLMEIDLMLRMIPDKYEVLEQALSCYSDGKVLQTKSVKFPRNVYEKVIKELPEVLKDSERGCFHVLYETTRVIDESMDVMEDRFSTISSNHSVEQAQEATIAQIEDLLNALRVTSDWALSVKIGKPINVYN